MRWAGLVAVLGCTREAVAGPEDYHLRESYLQYGVDEFWNKWDFFNEPDPSGGSVQYVDRETAMEKGLTKAFPANDVAYIGVDRENVASILKGRPSVRIQSKAIYNSGLFIVQIDHMPTGCGTWPAFWMYGEDRQNDWPKWGEYDIIEGMHSYNSTMTTLHTNVGCTQQDIVSGVHFTQLWNPGEDGRPAQNCDVASKGQFQNQGCSQSGPQGSMGPAFNARGGGTYAADWDPDAMQIRTWFWPAGSEPEDVRQGSPRPELWGTPYSYFSLDPLYCGPGHFHNMRLVFNVNLCGDLGAPTFAGSCPAESARMTCQAYITNPEHMKEAYWSIRKLDVYDRVGAVPTTTKLPAPVPTRNPYVFVADAGAGQAPQGSGPGRPAQVTPPSSPIGWTPGPSGPLEGLPVPALEGRPPLSLSPAERAAAFPGAPPAAPGEAPALPGEPADAQSLEQPGALRGPGEPGEGISGHMPTWIRVLGLWAAGLGALGLVLVVIIERRRADEGDVDGPVSYQGSVKFGSRAHTVVTEWWEVLCYWWRQLSDWAWALFVRTREAVRERCPHVVEFLEYCFEKLRALLAELWRILSDWLSRFCSWVHGLHERARTWQSYSRLLEITSSCHGDEVQDCITPSLRACYWRPLGSTEVTTTLAAPAGAARKLPEEDMPPTPGCTLYRAPRSSPFQPARQDLANNRTLLPGMQGSPYADQTHVPGSPPRAWSFSPLQRTPPPMPRY